MKKLNIAILGVEHCHMPGYAADIKYNQKDFFNVIAVADTNIDKGERIAKYFRAKYYKDYEVLLDSEKLDCVFLEPIVLDHEPMSRAALDKDLHILCEKPIAETWEKTKDIYSFYNKKEGG